MSRPGTMRRALAAAAAAGWAALLLLAGSRPGDALPASRILDLPGADKVAHALAYGILGALAAWAAAPRSSRRALLFGLFTGLLCGMLDEWVQGRVPGRTRSLADLLADAAGAAAGGWFVGRLRRSREEASSATIRGSEPRGEGT